MSKLQELYEAREKLKSLGIEPNADLEKQLSELEEKIIRDEIVPIITDKVEPVLKQVRREVVIVVENSPENGINVYLSRKRNVTSALSDAISISLNQPELSTYNVTESVPRPQRVAESTRIERPRSGGMKKATNTSPSTPRCEKTTFKPICYCTETQETKRRFGKEVANSEVARNL